MSQVSYDSTQDTLDHIERVATYLNMVADDLRHRAKVHDQSKLEEPEKSAFDRLMALRLSDMEYGSDEYRASLRSEHPFIQHHYEHNSHHPEHYPDGVSDMNLLDIIEMLVDWKAASERMADGGDIIQSIEHNDDRFGLDYHLTCILKNTAKYLGWAE